MPTALKFSLDDAVNAYDDWGSNCGPGALAAIAGKSLEEVRPHIPDFEARHYTNPTMMIAAMKSLKLRFRRDLAGRWPTHGLVRIQWGGPWCNPGVPAAAAYRHTHWVGAQAADDLSSVGIFDINAMNSGGWISLADWGSALVPWLLKETTPRADGSWWMTHVYEVEK